MTNTTSTDGIIDGVTYEIAMGGPTSCGHKRRIAYRLTANGARKIFPTLKGYKAPVKAPRKASRKPTDLATLGERNFAAEEGPLPKTACVYVQIEYMSMGGERLAFNAGPMTAQRAQDLRSEMRKPTSMALDAFLVAAEYKDRARHSATRLVVLPSQAQRDGDYETWMDGDAESAIARPTPVDVQGDWIEALAL